MYLYLARDDFEPVSKRPRHSLYPMVEVDKALELILSKTFRKPARVMAVNYGNEWHMQLHTHLSIVHYYFCDLGIVGYVIAEDVYASIALPPFPASVKDGYAVVGE